jgi:hypothetical protein
LGRKLRVQHAIVARAWRDAGLQSHRLERYMTSTDPDFETKAADVIGALSRHRSAEFVAFLAAVVDTQPRRLAIRVMVRCLATSSLPGSLHHI